MEGQLGTWKYGYSVSPRGSDFWVARDSIRIFLLLNEERPFTWPPFESSSISRVDGDLVVTSWFSKLGKKTCHHGFKPFVSSSPSCFLMGVPTHLVTFQSKTISSGRQLEVPIDNLQTAEGTIGSCDVCWENPESGSSDLLGEVRHARPQQFYSDRSDLSNPGKGNSPLHGGDFSDLRIWNPKMAETFITECNKGNKGFFSRTILVFKDELLCLVKKGKSESWRTFLWKWNLRQNVSATVIPLN